MSGQAGRCPPSAGSIALAPAVSFQPLSRREFPLVADWLVEPLVARWWHQDSSAAGVEREFGPVVDGREPSDVFIAIAERRSFGLIQRYRIDAYADYLRDLGAVWPVPAGALSIDYLIGDPAQRGRGLGVGMIAAFTALSWRQCPRSADIVVPVPAGNRASWRALERAGFRRVAAGELDPDNPSDPRDHLVYHLRR